LLCFTRGLRGQKNPGNLGTTRPVNLEERFAAKILAIKNDRDWGGVASNEGF